MRKNRWKKRLTFSPPNFPNNPAKKKRSGTLSSYAYVLMCVHLLQTRRPHPALPVLQSEAEANRDGLGFDVDVPGGVAGSTLSSSNPSNPTPLVGLEGGAGAGNAAAAAAAPSPGVVRWRVRYSDDPARFSALCRRNSESLAELLYSFFEYWSWHHDYANSVVSVRTGGWLTKAQKDWTRRVVSLFFLF